MRYCNILHHSRLALLPSGNNESIRIRNSYTYMYVSIAFMPRNFEIGRAPRARARERDSKIESKPT